MNLQHVFAQSDAIGKAVAILLLLMSIASWVVILWKAWLLRRAGGDVVRSVAAFWQAPSLDDAASRVGGFDRGQLVLPLVQWLKAHGVRFQYGTEVTDVDFDVAPGRVQRDLAQWLGICQWLEQ